MQARRRVAYEGFFGAPCPCCCLRRLRTECQYSSTPITRKLNKTTMMRDVQSVMSASHAAPYSPTVAIRQCTHEARGVLLANDAFP